MHVYPVLKMVSRRYADVEAVLDAVLQDEFGLSDGEVSDEEGEDLYV